MKGNTPPYSRVDGMKPPKALDAIADVVLAYRPKAKRREALAATETPKRGEVTCLGFFPLVRACAKMRVP